MNQSLKDENLMGRKEDESDDFFKEVTPTKASKKDFKKHILGKEHIIKYSRYTSYYIILLVLLLFQNTILSKAAIS